MEEKFTKICNRLLDQKWYDEVGIGSIQKKIEEGDYVLLPDTIAIGPVYKISYEGDLENDGYEKGFLFLPEGSGIKKHTHTNDIEQYTLIGGDLKVNGESIEVNRCLIGESHGIDPVSTNTAVKTLKISKKLIDENMNKKTY